MVDKFPAVEVTTKLAVSVGVGMVIGFEREWSHKDAGTRTFALTAVLGMLCGLLGLPYAITGLAAVILTSLVTNSRKVATGSSLETTTSISLIVTAVLGIMIGQGHVFAPISAAIVITMLLSLKQQFRRMTGGVNPKEIQSAVLLGLIAFVIYPTLPGRFVDKWQLFNPREAWVTVIVVASIGFVNYVLLRIYSQRGLLYAAILGGLVNSTATAAELAQWVVQPDNDPVRLASVITLLTTIAMFVRNLAILAIFSGASALHAGPPLAIMIAMAALFIWRARRTTEEEPVELELDSPLSLSKILRFGAIFLAIQVAGTLAERHLGSAGFLLVSIIGGLVSSASSAAAAAHLAASGQLSPELAGIGTVLASMASAMSSLPLVQRVVNRSEVTRNLWILTVAIVGIGTLVMVVQHLFHF